MSHIPPAQRMLFIVSALGFFLVLSLLSTAVSTAAPPDLPPRPTVEPTATSVPLPTAVATPIPRQGGTITLQVTNGSRTMWSIVQWQDALGDWHDVEGWRGHLDERTPNGQSKTWWVAPDDLGKGPFRWQIFATETGPLLTTTDPFHLPAAHGQIVTIPAELP